MTPGRPVPKPGRPHRELSEFRIRFWDRVVNDETWVAIVGLATLLYPERS